MSNFKKIIEHLYTQFPDDALKRGNAFERYCKWFLKNDPRYSSLLKNVWLWREWPGNWGRDKGIDLITETHCGKIWAIQVKAYDERYHITKEDVDTFLSESAREEIAYRLLIATTNNIGHHAREVMNAQEKKVGLCLLNNLEGSPLDWLDVLNKPDAVVKKEIRAPRPHQEKALQDILAGLEVSSYGQVHMACGTGKTLVGRWLAERLSSNTTLVLVPSISLVSQLYREWISVQSDSFNFDPFFVCSDSTVGNSEEDHEDSMEARASLGFPVTTNVSELLDALKLSTTRPRVIFSTYHSSLVIKEACKRDATLIFDLVIADEAHRCAGKAKSDFAVIIDKTAIRAKRKVFMTATPKIFSENVKKKTQEVECEVISMDDEDKFGPVFHTLPFSQAIKVDLLSDYQVVISIMNHKMYQEYAEKGRFVVFNDCETDARTLASQLLIAKAIKEYDLKKVITFHSRTKSAREFMNGISNGLTLLEDNERPLIPLTGVVSFDMLQTERLRILNQFKEQVEGCAILGNVKCLSEGVDVPALDGIAFIDPKGSEIDIVQAVGRVIRKPSSGVKKVGTIIIPIFVDTDTDEIIALEQSCFQVVWKIIKALRAHDDVLGEEIDAMRLELGKRTHKKAAKLNKIVINVPVGIDVEFGKTLSTKLIKSIAEHCSWIWMPFEEARKFVRALGLKSETEWRLYIIGKMPHLPVLLNDIPRAPWVAYANSGWISWGDFLGTGVIAPRLRRYRSYEEAREFAHGLNLTRKDDWFLYLKGLFPDLPCLPDDIPACPDKTYRRADYGKKWNGWGDFLGTARVSNQNKRKRWRTYEDAQSFVQPLNLKTAQDWFKYIKGDFPYLPFLPDDIPRKPHEFYQEWLDWSSFLGNNIISKFNCQRVFWPFEKARDFARTLGLRTQVDWVNYCAGKFPSLPPKPLEIPSNLNKKYKKDWVGYKDWFGVE